MSADKNKTGATETELKLAAIPEMAPFMKALQALRQDLEARFNTLEQQGTAADLEQLELEAHAEVGRLQQLAMDGIKARHAQARDPSPPKRRRKG